MGLPLTGPLPLLFATGIRFGAVGDLLGAFGAVGLLGRFGAVGGLLGPLGPAVGAFGAFGLGLLGALLDDLALDSNRRLCGIIHLRKLIFY